MFYLGIYGYGTDITEPDERATRLARHTILRFNSAMNNANDESNDDKTLTILAFWKLPIYKQLVQCIPE